MVLGLEKSGLDKNFSGPEYFFQVQAFQTEQRARYSTMARLESSFWRGLHGGGGEGINFRSRKFVFDLGARNKAAQARQAKTSQDTPTQAKGSLQGQMTSVSLAGVWLKLSTSALGTM